jgi:hypothetical protein
MKFEEAGSSDCRPGKGGTALFQRRKRVAWFLRW